MNDVLLTLKMTTAQVVKMSVTSNSLSEDYHYPDDHTRQTYALFCFVFLCQIQVLPDSSVDNLVLIECFPSEGTGYLCGVTFNAVDL